MHFNSLILGYLSFALQCNQTIIRGNSGQKVGSCPKLPGMQVGLYYDVMTNVEREKGYRLVHNDNPYSISWFLENLYIYNVLCSFFRRERVFTGVV